MQEEKTKQEIHLEIIMPDSPLPSAVAGSTREKLPMGEENRILSQQPKVYHSRMTRESKVL